MRWIITILLIISTGLVKGQDSLQCILEERNIVEFSEENLKEYICLKKIKHPEIVYAQALIETGGFTSTIYKQNNNLFGMKYVYDCKSCKIVKQAHHRQTTAVGSKYGHAKYNHWTHSVDDYLLWQKMFSDTWINKEKNYLYLLGKYYAEDKKYIEKIRIVIAKTRQQYYDDKRRAIDSKMDVNAATYISTRSKKDTVCLYSMLR